MLKACKINGKGQLCGEKIGTSTAIQVKGPSIFWHSTGEGSPFYTAYVVNWFVDNMQIGVIRAAMGIRYLGDNTNAISASGSSTLGYYDDADGSKRRIKTVVDAAIINDIYVIVDWHSHNAESETALATKFFREMAEEYKNVPNIIWEIYNEPVNTSTSSINSYANTIIRTIRDAGSKNLVLIGSPQWSQQPNEQAGVYGSSDKAVTDNVGFAFHFYAGTHPKSGSIGTSSDRAMSNGYAVFGTEWGFTNANGDGAVQSGSEWTSWMDNNKISNCNWNASNKAENSSMFTSSTSPTALSTSNLTTSGKNFQTYMNNNRWTAQIPANHPKGNDYAASVKDGQSVTITATQLSADGTISEGSQPERGSVEFSGNSIVFTTSPSGHEKEKEIFTYKITKNSITVQRKVTVTITDRRPILPYKNPIAVSRKAPKRLSFKGDLSAVEPNNLTMSFKEVSLSDPSVGSVEIVGTGRDTLIFTPSASMHNVDFREVTLNYAIQNTKNAFSSASVLLQLQNRAPTVNTSTANFCCVGSHPNTGPVYIGISRVGARDEDNDSLWFAAYHLASSYPGRLEKIKPDTLVYYPEAGKIGSIIILSAVTDGSLFSGVGKSVLTLTGSGTNIGNITPPNDIPGYTPPAAISPSVNIGGLGIKALGSGNVALHFAQSGVAKLDVYSISGKNMGTLINSWQNAGSSEVSLRSLNLQKGVYILHLRQGTQVKTLRIINK
jgi:hypothetical protein